MSGNFFKDLRETTLLLSTTYTHHNLLKNNSILCKNQSSFKFVIQSILFS